MPRRHRPPKRRDAEKIRRKRTERKLEEARLKSGVGFKARSVAEALGMRGKLDVDESLSCALFLDEQGTVRDVLRFDEIERKYRLLTGGTARRYEIVQEITYFLEKLPTAELVGILSELWRKDAKNKSRPRFEVEGEPETPPGADPRS